MERRERQTLHARLAGGSLPPAGIQWTTGNAGSPISRPIREQMEQQHPTDLRCSRLHQPENSGGTGATLAAEPKAEADFPEQGIPWAERAEGGSGI